MSGFLGPAIDGATALVWGFVCVPALPGRTCKVISSECFNIHKHRFTDNQRVCRSEDQLLAG